MRKTGRSTKTMVKALKLAEKHDVVPILVPNHRVGAVLARLAHDHMPLGKSKEEAAALLRRLRYVTESKDLCGIPRTPLLADHTWHERYAWVFEATQRVEATL